MFSLTKSSLQPFDRQGMQSGLEQLIHHWTERRFGGRLLFEGTDPWGEVEVVEHKGVRSLHFGRPEKQSAMSVQRPHQLTLEYTKAMVAGLALATELPKRVLCIGLGGGSIPKFLLSTLPHCRVDVVELRPLVVELAQKFFSLPKDPRLHLLIADCKDFLAKVQGVAYDFIFVDAFSKEGTADSVQGYPFFRRIKAILGAQGIVAINYWSEPRGLYQINHCYLSETFAHQVMSLPIPDRTNKILFSFAAPNGMVARKQFLARSKELETQLQISLPLWADRIQPDPFIK